MNGMHSVCVCSNLLTVHLQREQPSGVCGAEFISDKVSARSSDGRLAHSGELLYRLLTTRSRRKVVMLIRLNGFSHHGD